MKRSRLKWEVSCLLILLMLTTTAWSANNTTSKKQPKDERPQATSFSPSKTTLFLSGVIIYGKERKALFEIRKGNSTAKKEVSEGGKIGGYTLDKVEKERVVLTYGGESRTLLLKRGTVEVKEKQVTADDNRTEGKTMKREKAKRGKIERYRPGEIDLSEHKNEVRRGIMGIIQAFPNPAANLDENSEERR